MRNVSPTRILTLIYILALAVCDGLSADESWETSLHKCRDRIREVVRAIGANACTGVNYGDYEFPEDLKTGFFLYPCVAFAPAHNPWTVLYCPEHEPLPNSTPKSFDDILPSYRLMPGIIHFNVGSLLDKLRFVFCYEIYPHLKPGTREAYRNTMRGFWNANTERCEFVTQELLPKVSNPRACQKLLNSQDFFLRMEAIICLGEARYTQAEHDLLSLYQSCEDPQIQCAILWALGTLGSNDSLKFMLSILDTWDVSKGPLPAQYARVIYAAHSVGRLKRTEAIPSLLRVFPRTKDVKAYEDAFGKHGCQALLSISALRGIGYVGTKDAAQALAECAKISIQNGIGEFVCREAADRIVEIGEGEIVSDILRRATADPVVLGDIERQWCDAFVADLLGSIRAQGKKSLAGTVKEHIPKAWVNRYWDLTLKLSQTLIILGHAEGEDWLTKLLECNDLDITCDAALLLVKSDDAKNRNAASVFLWKWLQEGRHRRRWGVCAPDRELISLAIAGDQRGLPLLKYMVDPFRNRLPKDSELLRAPELRCCIESIPLHHALALAAYGDKSGIPFIIEHLNHLAPNAGGNWKKYVTWLEMITGNSIPYKEPYKEILREAQERLNYRWKPWQILIPENCVEVSKKWREWWQKNKSDFAVPDRKRVLTYLRDQSIKEIRDYVKREPQASAVPSEK